MDKYISQISEQNSASFCMKISDLARQLYRSVTFIALSLVEASYLRCGARLIVPRTNACLVAGHFLSDLVPADNQ